jgi:tetratricopeptide (TPR) repeat protein
MNDLKEHKKIQLRQAAWLQPTVTAFAELDAQNPALRAIYLDPKNRYAHFAFANACNFSSRLEQAILAAERAIELSPSFALGHFSLGVAHLFSGRASEAITPFRRGLRLSPYDPQNPVWSNFLAVAQFFAGDPESALLTSAHALGTRPDWRPIVETVACCYAATGKWDEARRCVRQMTGLPALPYAALAPLWERNPHWRDKVDDLLRKAGWTEGLAAVSNRRWALRTNLFNRPLRRAERVDLGRFAAGPPNDRYLRIPLKKPSSIPSDGEARRVLEKGWKGYLGGAWAAIPGAMRPAFPEAYSSVSSGRGAWGFGRSPQGGIRP